MSDLGGAPAVAAPAGARSGAVVSTDGPLFRLLSRYRGKRCFVKEYPGNHGDALINLGTRVLFRRAGLIPTSKQRDADIVAVKGGFGISDVWQMGTDALREVAADPDVPIVVLPSSYRVHPSVLHGILSSRSAPAYLFCRERDSFERLHEVAKIPGVQVEMDHDAAFWLAGSRLLGRLRAAAAQEWFVVVEREDAEARVPSDTSITVTPPALAASRLSALLRTRLFPYEAKLRIRRLLLSRRESPLRPAPDWAGAALAATLPGVPAYPSYVADISARELVTFKEFSTRIARSRAVATTRLHAGILAALLGKPTILRADPLGKLSGVFRYSMADLPHVHLWNDTGEGG